jgi:excisionase family DNA binding protein
MPTPRNFRRPIVPTEAMVASAEELIRHLSRTKGRLVVVDPANEQVAEAAPELVDLFARLLTDVAKNRPMLVMPIDDELTTVQAADFLNVSRPYVIKLIDNGELPCHMVGSHRRIRLDDLVVLKKAMRAKSEQARQELADLSQELDMGY